MKNLLLKMNSLTSVVNSEAEAFATGNNSAGARMRKALLELKKVSHEMRLEVSKVKNIPKLK
jgi:hypothetical protein